MSFYIYKWVCINNCPYPKEQLGSWIPKTLRFNLKSKQYISEDIIIFNFPTLWIGVIVLISFKMIKMKDNTPVFSSKL